MSMSEALRAIRGAVPWLRDADDEPAPPVPPTPLEEAESLVLLAKSRGLIERESPTWKAVSSWAAMELIAAQRTLETATGDKATAVRGSIKTLRDLLAVDEQAQSNMKIEDSGPDIP